MLRKTYAKIDLQAIGDNIEELKRLANTQVMAVVKADAYGHGMVEVAKEAVYHGVKYFAVATADEACELRKNIEECEILILSSVEEDSYELLISSGITLTVYTPKDIYAINEAALKLGTYALINIKIDTGMGRIGLRTDDELAQVLDAVSSCKNVRLTGIFTHFATADEADAAFTKRQFERFIEIKEKFYKKGFKPLCHAANSAAIIAHENTHLDICRMGISMYGYPPSYEVDMTNCKLRPAMSIYSHVTYVKRIKAGDTVSYGRIFTAKRDTDIATVAIGYADGYRRSLSNKAKAFINGEEVAQVGRVCMDQVMFDVTGKNVNIGDEVMLMGEGFTADDMAKIAGTISYEIICGISKRVPRVYVK